MPDPCVSPSATTRRRTRPHPRLLPFLVVICALGALHTLSACSGGSGHSASEPGAVPKRLPVSTQLSKRPQRLRWGRVQRQRFALDHISRRVPKRGRIGCPKVPLVTYAGTFVRYHRTAKVNIYFKERLKRFERVVAQVSTQVYGRPPTRIRHYGAYNCRGIRGRRKRLSEHGLGNALDVAGFEFAATATPRTPWSHAFSIRVKKHWGATSGQAATHARFLRLLLLALRDRPDIFRGMIGPPDPGHHDHFHFDVAPYRYMKAVAHHHHH